VTNASSNIAHLQAAAPAEGRNVQAARAALATLQDGFEQLLASARELDSAEDAVAQLRIAQSEADARLQAAGNERAAIENRLRSAATDPAGSLEYLRAVGRVNGGRRELAEIGLQIDGACGRRDRIVRPATGGAFVRAVAGFLQHAREIAPHEFDANVAAASTGSNPASPPWAA
jgi:hypothetical protein